MMTRRFAHRFHSAQIVADFGTEEKHMARIATLDELRKRIPEPRTQLLGKLLPELEEQGTRFISMSPLIMIATCDACGSVEVSPRGDTPGFVRVEDARTLVIPERPGNNLAFGLRNILATGQIALIFLVPGTAETFRVSGSAEIYDDPEILSELGSADRPTLLAIRVRISRCFFHCGRSFLRSDVWNPNSWPKKVKVSFGKIIASQTGGDSTLAAQVDQRVEDGNGRYLWRND